MHVPCSAWFPNWGVSCQIWPQLEVDPLWRYFERDADARPKRSDVLSSEMFRKQLIS